MGAFAECEAETRFEWVRPDLKRSRRKRKGRRTKTVLLMRGWDDRLLQSVGRRLEVVGMELNWSFVLHGQRQPPWRSEVRPLCRRPLNGMAKEVSVKPNRLLQIVHVDEHSAPTRRDSF